MHVYHDNGGPCKGGSAQVISLWPLSQFERRENTPPMIGEYLVCYLPESPWERNNSQVAGQRNFRRRTGLKPVTDCVVHRL